MKRALLTLAAQTDNPPAGRASASPRASRLSWLEEETPKKNITDTVQLLGESSSQLQTMCRGRSRWPPRETRQPHALLGCSGGCSHLLLHAGASGHRASALAGARCPHVMRLSSNIRILTQKAPAAPSTAACPPGTGAARQKHCGEGKPPSDISQDGDIGLVQTLGWA